jgi:type I restriction enzyme S subunit
VVHIYSSGLSTIKVSLPTTVAEQKAISSSIMDFNSEIENLEKKKIKYQSIKQGMMQELLTGKTRLNYD